MPEVTTDSPGELTKGSLLARNSFWNLVGQAVPMLIAFFAIPLLLKRLGTDRFGILTLVWMLIGYFSLFDFGLGRALSQLVAAKLGLGEKKEIPPLIWTSLIVMTVMGTVGALLVVLLSPFLVSRVLNIPMPLQHEAIIAFYFLAVSIPVVVNTVGLRGVLEAYQRFGLVSFVRALMGFVTYLTPLAVLPFSPTLPAVVGALALGRLLTWLVHFVLCLRVVPGLTARISFHRQLLKPLARFGSWMTVSNTLGPFLVYLDRFLIGGILSVSAVAYYATPYDMITKLWIIPDAIVGVLFPAFAASYAQDRARAMVLSRRGVKYLFLAMFPVTLLIIAFAHQGMSLWLGEEFASHSARVLQWLAVGVFVNSLARVPFALLQGAGRPDVTAKLHLVELPVYIPVLWVLVSTFGIEGAAIAWVIRVTLDAVLLFIFAGRFMPNTWEIKPIVYPGIVCLITMALVILPVSFPLKSICLSVALTIFSFSAWFIMITVDEKRTIRERIKMALPSS